MPLYMLPFPLLYRAIIKSSHQLQQVMSSSSNIEQVYYYDPFCSSPTQEDFTFTCLISLQEAAFGFTPYLLLLLWGHGLASRKRVISIRLFFFSNGDIITFLAGHRKDPEKTIRKGQELPLFLASSSL
jgi:hypothetical protein